MGKRIAYLDSLKAILILLVILGHAVQFNTEEYETNPLFQFIYSFHMPLFLFISGYLSCRGGSIWVQERLGIYACHFVIFHHLESLVADFSFSLRVAVSFLLTAIISYILVVIVSHIAYVRTFLIGQR